MAEKKPAAEARPLTAVDLDKLIKALKGKGVRLQSIEEEVALRFTDHPPKPGQPEKYQILREHAHGLALSLIERCPHCMELNLALTRLEEVVFWANAAIARRG